jgi:hypothetical protein
MGYSHFASHSAAFETNKRPHQDPSFLYCSEMSKLEVNWEWVGLVVGLLVAHLRRKNGVG